MSAGLGIKIPSPPKVEKNGDAVLHASGSGNRSGEVANDWSELSGTRGLQSTLRSASSMRGLLLAEVGDAMVELDICGEGSGFRQGHRIAFDDSLSSGGGLKHENLPWTSQDPALSRHGTLLSVGANPGRNAAELKSILGNSSARLKSGATLLPESDQSCYGEERTVFEQAKSRARVELDIILDSKICVQGGYLQGHIQIQIRSPSKKESPVMISDGKVRVIGFECISNEHDRYPFYQCSALLSAITTTPESLRGYSNDAEGFAPAIEGVHTLAFSMHLPMSTEHGVPKGVLHAQTGVAVRYIAMASIKVKDSETGKRSIAHFYRNCEVWPRLNPTVILVPAIKPPRMTTSRRLFMGGTGKVTLTATLHRSHWIAGQQCCVKVNVTNATKKAIKSLTLSLVRCTVVFKPDARLDAVNDDLNMDPDACQTSTTQKVVAESILEPGQRGARGYASAKGWWAGVRPGEDAGFFHFIQLPSDALSITRSRLLEVDYSLRVTLSAGALRTTDVQVTLPVRIVNFLSIDPPPSFPLTSPENHMESADFDSSAVPIVGQLQRNFHSHSRPVVAGLFGSYGPTSRPLESLAEADDESPMLRSAEPYNGNFQDDTPENAGDESGLDGEWPMDTDEKSRYDHFDPSDELCNLSMYEDDADEVVQRALSLAGADEYENAPRFADLYYVSIQEDLGQLTHGMSAHESSAEPVYECDSPHSQVSNQQQLSNLRTRNPEGYPDLRPYTCRPITVSRPNRPRGPSSFAQRVQAKREAHGITESGSATSLDSGEGGHRAQDSCNTPTGSSYTHDSPISQKSQGVSPSRDELGVEAGKLAGTASSGGCLSIPHEPLISSSTASSMLMSGTNCNGSRLLPRPPSMANCLPPALESVPIPPPDPATIPTVPIHKYVAQEPDHVQSLEQGSSGSPKDNVRSANVIVARPKLRAQLGGESTSSVKDKIKELEERMKAAEQL